MPVPPSHPESPTVFPPDSLVSWLMTISGAFELIASFVALDYLSPPKPKLRDGVQIPVSALEHLRYEKMLDHIYWFPSPFHDGRTLVVVFFIHILLGVTCIYAGSSLRRYVRKGLTLLVVLGILSLLLGGWMNSAFLFLYAGIRFTGKYGPKFA